MQRKLLILLLFVSLSTFGQIQKLDSVPVKSDSITISEGDLFSELDLVYDDSDASGGSYLRFGG